MSQLKRYIKTDIMKLKSTIILWIHIAIPILGLATMLGYYSFSPWDKYDKILAYMNILCGAFPILIGIITAIVAEEERLAGNFQNLLASSPIKSVSLVSKYLVIVLLGVLSTFIAVIGFYLVFSRMETNIGSANMYILIGIIMLVGNLFLYTLHFFLSFRFTKNISIGIGIAESLIVLLFRTGLGDGIWPLVPCSWSIRFIRNFLIAERYRVDVFSYADVKLGIVICVAATISSFFLLLMWFTRWEGSLMED